MATQLFVTTIIPLSCMRKYAFTFLGETQLAQLNLLIPLLCQETFSYRISERLYAALLSVSLDCDIHMSNWRVHFAELVY